WRIDQDTLQRLLRRDMIGWGYTLFLPWGTYKPEITQVHLKVRYEPAHGTPVYSESSSMTLNKIGDIPVTTRQIVPNVVPPNQGPSATPKSPLVIPETLPPPQGK